MIQFAREAGRLAPEFMDKASSCLFAARMSCELFI